MSHKDAVHNDPFVCLIRRLNPDKKVVMRRPASLLSVEKNGGRGKRRARSECEFYRVSQKKRTFRIVWDMCGDQIFWLFWLF